MIIDSHIHLDHKRFDDDIDKVIKDAKQCGVERFIIPGADIDDLPKAVKLSERYNEVYFSVGCHPYDIDKYDQQKLLKYIAHDKCVAVGECGLDYYRLPKDETKKAQNIQTQKQVFVSQINLAKKFDKPLIVHIRDASSDARDILLEQKASDVGGVLHCYNASPVLLDMADHNFYFGIGGVITFKNAKDLADILPQIPKDKLMIETDAPYLTPHPHRGERNEPKYCVEIAQKIADVLGLQTKQIREMTTKNTRKLFDI